MIYSLPSIVAMPIIANDEKIEKEWRKTMEEPLPVYFNPDGTRTEQALHSLAVTPRPIQVAAKPAVSRNVITVHKSPAQLERTPTPVV